MSALTIDSYAWIEVIRGTPLGMRSKELIEGAENSYTPAIVLAEVAHRCIRDGMEQGVVQQELRAMVEASMIVPIDGPLATAAAKATILLRDEARARRIPMPGLSDGLVLATARKFGSGLLTGDAHFQGLPETLWLA
ncbi:MAG: PIN domain-containing protein [Thermoplasmata archaeon]|nr:PIN domain-containing protein [Thermoplasmata archaeon]